jgi:glutamate-ammonia-ligase adenylyltransferase
MRERMLAAHPNRSALFDIKHDRGGIIDVEFIVQYLVLAYARAHAALTGNIGNLALLKLAASLGLIACDEADRVHAAYREYRRLQHALRLRGDAYARVEREALAGEISAVSALWSRVFAKDGAAAAEEPTRPSSR